MIDVVIYGNADDPNSRSVLQIRNYSRILSKSVLA